MATVVAPATLFQPATTVTDQVFGDNAGTIANTALAQTFIFKADSSQAYGDALNIEDTGRGGADTFNVVSVGAFAVNVNGDADRLRGSAQGGDDQITMKGSSFVSGDANAMEDQSVGGDDVIRLSARAAIFGVGNGDANQMGGETQGGDDRLYGNRLFGDAGNMLESARGGDDRLFGQDTGARLFGDAGEMQATASGGNDFIIANGANSLLYGDAEFLFHSSHGGDDYLHNKAGGCSLLGDARLMQGVVTAGNDVLSGSPGQDIIFGDAQSVTAGGICGDDVLLGGKGNDALWGDAESFDGTETRGADRFVFGGISGKDTIGDFQHGIDVIDVQQLGYTSFAQLTINETGGDTIVHFQGINQVRVEDVTGLTAADFLFA